MQHDRLLPFVWRMRVIVIAVLSLLVSAATSWQHAFAQPITSDSRIKTFVYNANEVFTITTHYGYQSNIEFGPKESIETISVGDRVGWQIVPTGRRLFIRAMEENARTNMTVVTNQRAYQFDLRSSSADAVFGSEELTYVVRFFYPGEASANAPYIAPVASAPIAPVAIIRDLPAPTPSAPIPAPRPEPAVSTAPSVKAEPLTAAAPRPPLPVIAAAPVAAATKPPMPVLSAAPVTPAPPEAVQPAAPVANINYLYTFSGPSDIAPTKIYDDGRTTYFKLPRNLAPKIIALTAQGEAVEVQARRTAEGLLAVDTIAPRFTLNQVGREVVIYNEAKEG